jgi:hypothetical protein
MTVVFHVTFVAMTTEISIAHAATTLVEYEISTKQRRNASGEE